jgi:hypothetical protein
MNWELAVLIIIAIEGLVGLLLLDNIQSVAVRILKELRRPIR